MLPWILRVGLVSTGAALPFAPLLWSACTPVKSAEAARSAEAVAFLSSRVVAAPPALRRKGDDATYVLSDSQSGRSAAYDGALVTLVLLREGRAEEAGRILSGLARIQSADGSIPFSFVLDSIEETRGYVRSGALAWVGYAAAEFLDAGGAATASASRAEILELAHRAAAYLLAHQVRKDGDRRDGLVTGGAGTYRYEAVSSAPPPTADPSPKSSGRGRSKGGKGRSKKPVLAEIVREVLVPGEVPWASVEHNIDSYFFLSRLARVTESTPYSEAAQRIRSALIARGYAASGQFASGVSEESIDETPALDCASWGAVFLNAAGEEERARASLSLAESRYPAADDARGRRAQGHRAYASGRVFADPSLAAAFGAALPSDRWEGLGRAIWPEGSAGVALAALRLGDRDRARAILEGLEPLRAADGSLPTSTLEIPFVFDTAPSVAGTAWSELVRYELARAPDRPTLWVR